MDKKTTDKETEKLVATITSFSVPEESSDMMSVFHRLSMRWKWFGPKENVWPEKM